MKFLILAALVATCACASLSFSDGFAPSPKQYVSGKEYEYDYESQIMTGLPTFSKQYAGMKILCKVKFAFTSATSCVMQMVGVKVMSWNDEVTEWEMLPPTEQLPAEHFMELPAEEARLIVSKLHIPLKFSYDTGKVMSLQVASEETNWSIDIKRGVLSMLQVKMQPEESKIIKKLPYNDLVEEGVSTFDVLEAGPEGTCYSTHHVFNCSECSNSEWAYKVIKARDHSRCIKMNSIIKNVYPQRQMNCDCSSNMNNQNCNCLPVASHWNTSATHYNKLRTEYELLSGDAKTFIIHKAVQSVEYRAEALYANNQYTMTTSNQTLIMVNQSDQITIRTDRWSFKSISEPWKMQILPKDEEKLMMSVEQLLQNIRQLLQDMQEIAAKPDRFDDHMLVFSQLVDNIRLCKQHELQALFIEKQNARNRIQWNTYLDALRSANTTAADQLLVNKMKTGAMHSTDAVPILLVWTAEKVPTRTLLDDMLNNLLPTLKTDASKKTIYYHSMLCFGSMVRRYIHSEEIWMSQCLLPNDKMMHQKNIYNCRKYEKYVEARLGDASTDEEKIMVLKTIANMGSIKSLPMLQNHLSNKMSMAVRVHAVWAFNNLGFQNKLKTTETLLPIMLHHHEDTELRCAAFIMVMKCNPTTSLWAIERHLNNERDVEFKTFVVKYLQNMLEKSEPRCEKRQMRIRQILKSIHAFRMSEETTDLQLKYGLKDIQKSNDNMLRLSVIANSTTNVPRSAAVQQLTGHNNEWNNLFELGFRAEGLGSIFSVLSEKESAPENIFQVVKDKLIGHAATKEGERPSVTLYVRTLGQQISLAHFDEKTIMSHSDLLKVDWQKASMSMEIPISLFHTVVLSPKQWQSFQPAGTWWHHEMKHVAVVDVEGVLRMEMSRENPWPKVMFKSSKPIRFEVKTMVSQYVNWGFAKTGLSGSWWSRTYANAQQISVSYDMEWNMLSGNFTNPNIDEMGHIELQAMSVTFVQPARLPKVVFKKSECMKLLKVDESERKTWSNDIAWLKGVELDAKLEGDVNMPQWYSFVRDRTQLIPISLWVHRQHLKLTVKPVKQSQTICMKAAGWWFTPTGDATTEIQNLIPDHHVDKRSIGEDWWSWWQSNDENKEMENVNHRLEEISGERRDHKWPLCQVWGVSVASVSETKAMNASANWTSCYEKESFDSHSVLLVETPSAEGIEGMQLMDEVYNKVDPSSGEVEQAHKIRWGPRSAPLSHTITLANKFKPSFKDDVCHNQTAYGCKDDYGVVYPIWYNNTMHIYWENNRVPEQIRDWVEPILNNMAESVYMYRSKPVSDSANSMKIDFIVRPKESMIDFIVQDSRFATDFSKVYTPVVTKIHNYIAVWQWQWHSTAPSSPVSYIGSLTNHHQQKQDSCVYESSKVHTFENKTLQLPKTDCEVVLLKRCDRTTDQLRVSVVPSPEMSGPKELHMLFGSKKIQMKFDESQVIKVYIDERLSEMNPEGRLMVKEGDRTIASIECHGGSCELDSRSHGLYVHMDQSRASIKHNDSDKPGQICGMCAMRSELTTDVSAAKSLAILRENLVAGDKSCNINEPCSKLKKYRVAYATSTSGDRLTCVTVRQQMLCSGACRTKSKHTANNIEATCVTPSQSRDIGLDKAQKTVGGEKVVDDPEVLKRLRSKGMAKNVQIEIYTDCRA